MSGQTIRNPDTRAENSNKTEQMYTPAPTETKTKFINNFGGSSGKMLDNKIERRTLKDIAKPSRECPDRTWLRSQSKKISKVLDYNLEKINNPTGKCQPCQRACVKFMGEEAVSPTKGCTYKQKKNV